MGASGSSVLLVLPASDFPPGGLPAHPGNSPPHPTIDANSQLRLDVAVEEASKCLIATNKGVIQ